MEEGREKKKKPERLVGEEDDWCEFGWVQVCGCIVKLARTTTTTTKPATTPGGKPEG